jgi:hypothetical protein
VKPRGNDDTPLQRFVERERRRDAFGLTFDVRTVNLK